MKIIPAIDLIDGKCVRLTKGDYATKKVYNEDPIEMAKSFQDAGITHLHLVDLDGAKAGRIINYEVLNRLSNQTNLHIDFGGGLKSDEDLKIAFENGASQITGGSIAVKNRDKFINWLNTFGAEKIILGADALNEKIAVSGWQEETNEDIFLFIKKFVQQGVKYTICTDISKDGMLEGPNISLYQKILSENNSLQLIASGGVSKMDDIHQLKNANLFGVVVGKAIYENKISLEEIYQFNKGITPA